MRLLPNVETSGGSKASVARDWILQPSPGLEKDVGIVYDQWMTNLCIPWEIRSLAEQKWEEVGPLECSGLAAWAAMRRLAVIRRAVCGEKADGRE